jgi:hypothetical protein
VVRKFVDEELSIDRGAEARKAREQREREEEERKPTLRQYLSELEADIEVGTEKLSTLDDDAWKVLNRRSPRALTDLLKSYNALDKLLQRVLTLK